MTTTFVTMLNCPGTSPLVHIQRSFRCESNAAELANIRPFSRVSPHVHFQWSMLIEPLLTDMAGIGSLPSVNPFMHHHRILLGKRFRAVLAFVRFVAGVDSQMQFELVSVSKALATYITQMGLASR